MNREVEDYLVAYDPPTVLRERIEKIAAVFTELRLGKEPDVLFISDCVDPEGILQYASLWGFQGPYWMECRGFSPDRFDVDISAYQGSIRYLGLEVKDMDLAHPATEKSRMQVEVSTDYTSYSYITAVGSNCDALLKIVRGLLLPALQQ